MRMLLSPLCTEPVVSDEVLALRARGGARAAFAALMARHQDRVYRLAMRMCHNADDAEEITQETFTLAYRAIASFEGLSRFSTWLYRIAVNQALMHRRASARRPTQPLDLCTQYGDGRAAEASGEPPERADDLLDRKLATERVMAALARLDEPHRAALVLRDLEELTAEEAAEILGVSPDVVRQRSHRARRRLREELGPFAACAP